MQIGIDSLRKRWATSMDTYRLVFSDLRVSKREHYPLITISGTMTIDSESPFPYELLVSVRRSGIPTITKFVDDNSLKSIQVSAGIYKLFMPAGYTNQFSFNINPSFICDDLGMSRSYYDPYDQQPVLVEGLEELSLLPQIEKRRHAIIEFPQIDSFDLPLREYVLRMESLLEKYPDSAESSLEEYLPYSESYQAEDTTKQEGSLRFSDIEIRATQQTAPSYFSYMFSADTNRTYAVLSGTVTNVSSNPLPITVFPQLRNSKTASTSWIDLNGIRSIEVAPGIWGFNIAPGQTVPFQYDVRDVPTYHLSVDNSMRFYRIFDGWYFSAGWRERRERVRFSGLEESPELITQFLRSTCNTEFDENDLLSDLISNGWNEESLRNLVNEGPYWIAGYSETAYAYHRSNSCPALARSATQAVSGYFIATSFYHRCSICG